MTENWKMCASSGFYNSKNGKIKLSELTCRLLANRGIIEETDIEKYLFPSFDCLYPSELLNGTEKAAQIVSEKISERKKIRVIGDYDVDGVVSAFVLTDSLRRLGADVSYAIPDRITEGYGLNIGLIEQAIEDGCDTIITCDNGISAASEIAFAKENGITVIVTDHHEIPERLPEADVVIDPKLSDCTYPFREICGAVVAAKTADVITKKVLGKSSVIRDYVQELALATVCDVMDLCDENRILVKLGLEKLTELSMSDGVPEKAGLGALLEKTGLRGKTITSTHIGFAIGPCINATGRLDTARRGVELLLSEDYNEALSIADELVMLNEERKAMTDEQVKKAEEVLSGDEYKNDIVYMIYLPACHESIAGIIAGRIKEKYYRPTVVFTDSNGMLKGSGRSIEGYNMFEEFSTYRELFEKFGGHALAAGMTILPDNFDVLRKNLNASVKLSEEQLLPKVLIDGIVPPEYLDEPSVSELSLLEPFGKGNRKPLLAVKNARIKRIFRIGKQGQYLKFILLSNGREFSAVYFGDSEGLKQRIEEAFGEINLQNAFFGKPNGITLTLAYSPSINEYMGNREISLGIQHFKM